MGGTTPDTKAANDSAASHAAGTAHRAGRWTGRIQWTSVAVIIVALIAIMRVLPIDRLIDALSAWIEGLGVWAPAVYAGIYALAAVLFVPGSALTIASGALFGLGWGTAAVSVGSTTGAAMAFLIARYFARDAVTRMASRNAKFAAIDNAIGKGGWKIVALLRLSPAVPFNLQNYLYGLTAIRFWPCVLTSWLAMLPGTFMYVYIGRIGRQGLEAAAAGGNETPDAAKWILTIVGFVATVVVTIFVTRLATRAVKEQTELSAANATPDRSAAAPADVAPARSWGPIVTAALALLLTITAACAHWKRDNIRGLFGPPGVEAREAYADETGAARFDHSPLDALLKKYVDDRGRVDYGAIQTAAGRLDEYVTSLGKAPFDELSRNEKLALLINAYNAFTLRLILDYYPIDSTGSLKTRRDSFTPGIAGSGSTPAAAACI